MPKPRYLRRKCNVCGYVGDVPKQGDNVYKDPTRWVFYAASPYQQELAGEDWFAWWCVHCIEQDAADIHFAVQTFPGLRT